MYYKKQKGLSLTVAIFILVIMALLAAAAVSILNKGHAGISQEVMSTRAFYAAESGAQYTLSQLFPLTGGASNCLASANLNYNATGLANCSSSMTCNNTVIGADSFYLIISTGTCSTGEITSVRTIEMMARTP